MATKRAKRLADYLENQLGWQTRTGVFVCKKCGARHFNQYKHCHECGAKLPQKSQYDEEVFEQLEDAIAFALKNV